jgi:hypothetical protein
MPFTPTPFVAGAKITAALVLAELAAVRTWLRDGIVVGDIDDDALNETHVYRTETFGFPKGATEGQTQDLYERQRGVSDGVPQYAFNGLVVLLTPGAPRSMRVFPDRELIFLNHLFNEEHRLPNLQARIVLDAISDVEVSASWYAVTQYDNVLVGAPLHPEGAGNFVIVAVNVDTGNETLLSETYRRINATYDTATEDDGHEDNHFSTGSEFEDLAAGTYDIGVRYRRDNADLAITQVIIYPTGLRIAVHKH